jgi:hypothetical protein
MYCGGSAASPAEEKGELSRNPIREDADLLRHSADCTHKRPFEHLKLLRVPEARRTSHSMMNPNDAP